MTGASGLVGQHVAQLLHEKGFTVYGTYRTEKASLDITWVRACLENLEEILEVLNRARPDIVVHCAAVTDVDYCEENREHAYRINVLATVTIAKYCSKNGTYLIYISTDYVFDGKRGRYIETDIPNPVNYYGLTKLLGETAVLAVEHSLVVRTSNVFGLSLRGKKTFPIYVIEKLLRNEHVFAIVDMYNSPTYAPALAEAIYLAIEKGLVGILHFAGERTSRYELAIKIAELLNKPKTLVRPVSGNDVRFRAPRPRDSSLESIRKRELGLEHPPLVECLKQLVETLRRHWKQWF